MKRKMRKYRDYLIEKLADRERRPSPICKPHWKNTKPTETRLHFCWHSAASLKLKEGFKKWRGGPMLIPKTS